MFYFTFFDYDKIKISTNMEEIPKPITISNDLKFPHIIIYYYIVT